MTDDTKTETSPVEKVKLAIAVLLAVGGVVVYYVLNMQPTWQRWAAVAAGLILGAVMFMLSDYGRDFWRFVLDSRIELRKIVWPTRQETGTTTAVVFGFVLVMAVFFWLLDLGLAAATRFFSGQGG
jgi:preprotein translocase subunit SecE